MQAEKLTSFIARGDHNGKEIKNLQMIVNTTGEYKFDDEKVTGAILSGVNQTGFSDSKPIVYVNNPNISATDKLKAVTGPDIAGILPTPSAATSEEVAEIPPLITVKGTGDVPNPKVPELESKDSSKKSDFNPEELDGGARKRSYKQKTQKRRQKKQQRRKSRRV